MTIAPSALLFAGSLALMALLPPLDARGDEHNHMRLIGHNDLGGRAGGGKGSEGFALAQTASGRRILYVAEESGPLCFSVVDVTDPQSPQLVTQVEAPPRVRCNSLDLSGRRLTAAHGVQHAGLKPARLQVWDVSSPPDPRPAGFFQTSGPDSRGIHHVWFADGRFACVSTGTADFIPTNPKDDEFFMIVHLAGRPAPRRWAGGGTRRPGSTTPRSVPAELPIP